MPSINGIIQTTPIKVSIMGESGSGKTGLAGSLAAAGYKVRIADIDSGTDILHDPTILKPEFRGNVSVINLPVDEVETWDRFRKVLQKWDDGEENYGAITEWGSDVVLFVDSASLLTKTALRAALKTAGKSPDSAQFDQVIYGTMANMVYPVFAGLQSKRIKCNIVWNYHIRFREDDMGVQRGNFATEGAKLAGDIPKICNDVWGLEMTKEGKRQIRTRPTRLLGLKTTMPSVVKEIEEPDLGAIFRRMEAGMGKEAASSQEG